MVAYIALVQTDTHKDTGTCWRESAFWEGLLKPKKKKKNQRYDNLATKPRRQCSTLWAALRVLWFTDHVDIPPIALEHTHSYMQPGTNARPSTQKRPPDVCARAMRSESLFSLLPLQKPESLWRTFSFTLAETFAMEKNLSNNCYRKIKT